MREQPLVPAGQAQDFFIDRSICLQLPVPGHHV
jgi:hypothetical protein